VRISDIITENQEIDEGIGSTIGRGIGAVGRGIGAVASVPQGFGRAIKKGYQAGVRTIAGDDKPESPKQGGVVNAFKQGYSGQSASAGQSMGGAESPQQLRQQARDLMSRADQLERQQGQAAQPSASVQSQPQQAPSVQSQPQQAPAAAAGKQAAKPADVQNPMQNKKFMNTLQFLKPDEVEKIRGMLQARAKVKVAEVSGFNKFTKGVKQGFTDPNVKIAGSKAAGATKVGRALGYGTKKAVQGTIAGVKAAPGVAGKVAGLGTQIKQAYQQGRGAQMTVPDLQNFIATIDPKKAQEILSWFDSVHPVAAPTSQPNLKVQPGKQMQPESVFYSKFLNQSI
jgi:hypothetical protein